MSASDVPCVYVRPTSILGLVPVDVVLCYCLVSRDLEHPLFVHICLRGVLDVDHLLPSTIRAGDHDFCSPHECTYHRPFVLELMVGAEVEIFVHVGGFTVHCDMCTPVLVNVHIVV